MAPCMPFSRVFLSLSRVPGLDLPGRGIPGECRKLQRSDRLEQLSISANRGDRAKLADAKVADYLWNPDR